MTKRQEPKEGGAGEPGPTLPATPEQLLKWKANPLLLQARFPQDLVDPNILAQFMQVAIAIDLNPFLGEIVPIHGRPYITEEGWLRMIDERAPGQLVGDVVEMASKEEATNFGVKGGWLGKATVTRRVQTLDGKTADRVVTDYSFLSLVEVNASKITAITNEPWRQAMKGAHVRALRKAFRDVVARSASEYAVGGGDEAGIIIEAEAMEVVNGLAKAASDESTEATERKKFWARATEAGIRNGSEELAKLLGLPESGVGAMKEHWLDQGHTWMEANQQLSTFIATGEIPEQCSQCGKLLVPPDDQDSKYTTTGMIVCSQECGEKYEKAHPREEEPNEQSHRTGPRKRTTRAHK